MRPPTRLPVSQFRRFAIITGEQRTENGTQFPGLVYSEVNTPLAIDASGISGAVSPKEGLLLARDTRRILVALQGSHPAPSGESSIGGNTPPSEPLYFQKSLKRVGDKSVYRTVCWIFLCPR